MDLTLLLSSTPDSDVGAHNEQQEVQSEFRNRETLFKRKGINFSTTTNEGRILRSSQETDRRKTSRSIQHWKSRKDQNFRDKDGNSDGDRVRGKLMEEVKNKAVVKVKVEHGQGCDIDAGTMAKAQLSRREKLMAFISQKRQIDEEKRKKAKPVFRAGTVHHPYSVFSSAPSLQNQSRMSMSSSNLSLMTQSSQRRPTAGFSRSSSLTNIKISSKVGKSSLNKIIEDEVVPKQPMISEEPKPKGHSFAPLDHEFNMKLDTIALKKVPAVNPEVVKETFLESLSQTVLDSTNNHTTLATEHQEQDKDKVQDVADIESSFEDVKEFRDLLSKETKRINNLCQMWEAKIQTIPEDPDSELVKGELRSVVGQGRLVIKERFHQFSGLVDNCEFNRGEKKTTHEDLRGFWEMIFIQVEDVDRKFSNLSKVEANGWKEVIPVKTVRSKIVSKSVSSVSDVSVVKQKKASSGLKALIAARRKAAKSVSEPPSIAVEDSSKCETIKMSPTSDNEAKKDENQTQDDKTFDGGFFTVKSPMLERKSPRSCKSSSNKLRQAAFSNSTKSVNSFLLSPFISAMSKISLAQVQSSGSPMASEKLQSPLSPSRAPKPLILFKGDEEEEDVKSEDLGGKYDIHELSSPKLDECYFRPTLTPASCVDLISLESPYEIEQ